MAEFVLVPGAWIGGWAWADVARALRGQGHDVYPTTLTGLGERAHLAGPSVDLETHIKDIEGVLSFEDLHEVVLVGHSYAGAPVTGAADRAVDRLAKVVYVDSGPLFDGGAYIDMQPPPLRELIERRVAEEGDGWRLPMQSWDEIQSVNGASLEGLDEELRARIRERAVSHPFGTYTQPLHLKNPDRTKLPHVLVSNGFPIDQVKELIASGHPWFAELAGPQWSFVELLTSHWPMFSAPKELAEVLAAIARGDR
jgi:pimeloyl-ACP methyl ester carboxylesterase